MTTPLQTVHVRVNDAATGEPTPCRIRFTGPDEIYYAPFGRLPEFECFWTPELGGNVRIQGKEFAYIDGTCEVNLPVGPLRVEVAKGPEYVPLRQEMTLAQGKLSLRLEIERWADLRREGWYAGDVGAHVLTPFGALLEAAGEDLAVVNLLAQQVEEEMGDHGCGEAHLVTDLPHLVAFSGQRPALERPGHLVVVNTRNAHPVLGTLDLLNCHRIVYPLRFGGPHGADDWTLADWCDQCHRKGGLVVWSDLAAWSTHPEQQCGEALADVLLGKVDAVGPSLDQPEDWYALLNLGLRLPLLCGITRDFNDVPLGVVRTYAHLQPGEELTYPNWISAVRLGRTFVTEGPIVFLTVAGAGPGVVISEYPDQVLPVRVEVRGTEGEGVVEIIQNGEVISSAETGESNEPLVVETEVIARETGWLAVRVGNADGHIVAHTSPVFVRVSAEWGYGGSGADAMLMAPQRVKADPEMVDALRSQLDLLQVWVAEKARCTTEQHRSRLAGVFENAKQVLDRIAAG